MITKITYVLGVYKGIVRTVYNRQNGCLTSVQMMEYNSKKYVMDLKGFLFLTHPT